MASPADLPYSRAEALIWSRVAVLESKRLVLEHARRCVRRAPSPEAHARARRLREQVARAEAELRALVPPAGLPVISRKWRLALERLIATAEAAIEVQSQSFASLSAQRRFEVGAELEMLQALVDGWRSLISSP